MTINPKCILAVLKEYEALPYPCIQESISVDGFSESELIFHQQILLKEGFIEAKPKAYISDKLPRMFPKSLTFKGKTLLDEMKKDNNLEKTKQFLINLAKDEAVPFVLTKLLQHLLSQD